MPAGLIVRTAAIVATAPATTVATTITATITATISARIRSVTVTAIITPAMAAIPPALVIITVAVIPVGRCVAIVANISANPARARGSRRLGPACRAPGVNKATVPPLAQPKIAQHLAIVRIDDNLTLPQPAFCGNPRAAQPGAFRRNAAKPFGLKLLNDTAFISIRQCRRCSQGAGHQRSHDLPCHHPYPL
jgi:hypothetical protein